MTAAHEARVFDGRVVAGFGVRLAKAGMGLSDALSVDEDWQPAMGDTVTIVIECEVSKFQFERVISEGEDTGLARQIVTLDVLRAAPMSGKNVDKALRDVEKLVEQRKGVARLREIDEHADRETYGDDEGGDE